MRREKGQKQGMRQTGIVLLVLFCAVCLFSACGGQGAVNAADGDASPVLYYLTPDGDALYPVSYEISGGTQQERVQYVADAIGGQEAGASRLPLLPEDVAIRDVICQDHQVFLYFDQAYLTYLYREPEREILMRGGIVNSMMQVPEISGVSFYVNGMPLSDANGQMAGVMTEDSFSLSGDASQMPAQDLTLYFASGTGDQLVREGHQVVGGNSSKCRMILQELMAGPEDASLRGTIPEGAGLNNVYVLDGICFVNFDEGLLSANDQLPGELVIYSIVNSLTELPEVKSVQISINGDTGRIFRQEWPLTSFYTRNLDLVLSERP